MLFEHGTLDVFGGAEADFRRRPIPEIAQLGLHECAKVAGRAVLKVEHAVRRSIIHYYHPAADVISIHFNQIPFFEC
jgi:hypothetical protein